MCGGFCETLYLELVLKTVKINITIIFYICLFSPFLLTSKPTRSSKRSRFSSEDEERSVSSRSPRRSQRVTTVPQVRQSDRGGLCTPLKKLFQEKKSLKFIIAFCLLCRNSQVSQHQIKKPHRRLG